MPGRQPQHWGGPALVAGHGPSRAARRLLSCRRAHPATSQRRATPSWPAVCRFQMPEGLSLPNLDGLGAVTDETRREVASQNVLQLNATQVSLFTPTANAACTGLMREPNTTPAAAAAAVRPDRQQLRPAAVANRAWLHLLCSLQAVQCPSNGGMCRWTPPLPGSLWPGRGSTGTGLSLSRRAPQLMLHPGCMRSG